ncbi:MAG: Asp23/Gls24 family envelope stress response protein [Lentisphaeria bacterium]|nr:Asp23/Gls24 family envelope stress response protein [Lentisphaeria bacterium]
MSDVSHEQENSKSGTMILNDNELGDIRIHEGVIAAVARRAALAVDGVSRLAGSSLVDNIAEIVGSRRMQSRNINIILGEDNNAVIEIKVVMKFGFRIPDVAAEIQKSVITEVENTTAMNVTDVHVIVQDIEEENAAGDTADGNDGN